MPIRADVDRAPNPDRDRRPHGCGRVFLPGTPGRRRVCWSAWSLNSSAPGGTSGPGRRAVLARACGTRRALLLELVHAELEFRLKAGESARVEDYLRAASPSWEGMNSWSSGWSPPIPPAAAAQARGRVPRSMHPVRSGPAEALARALGESAARSGGMARGDVGVDDRRSTRGRSGPGSRRPRAMGGTNCWRSSAWGPRGSSSAAGIPSWAIRWP